jgi:hypothetical protein
MEGIRRLIGEHPGWSRRRISEALATQWDWRNGAGRLKDMAARSLLLKLAERGLVSLPPRRRAPTHRMGCRRVEPWRWEAAPLEGAWSTVGPVQVREVSGEPEGRALVACALSRFHYLGHGGTVGENLQYLVSAGDRPLACLLFGSAAWKCRDRDRFIGWQTQARERHLGQITNNTRFLILPWVRVRHLASWTLGQVTRRLSGDWQAKYGHGIALVETFVERERFVGTSYRAANWRKVGATTGRTRQDRDRSLAAPVKDIYLYPLRRDFREVLGACLRAPHRQA